MKTLITIAACGALALGAAACGNDDNESTASSGSGGSGDLSGNIKIDGSSTVAPFAQAAVDDLLVDVVELAVVVEQAHRPLTAHAPARCSTPAR